MCLCDHTIPEKMDNATVILFHKKGDMAELEANKLAKPYLLTIHENYN